MKAGRWSIGEGICGSDCPEIDEEEDLEDRGEKDIGGGEGLDRVAS